MEGQQEQLPVIVTSNVKKTVKGKSLNTSQETIDILNKKVHGLLSQAAENAIKDGRKTVMARDFEGL